MNDRVSACKGLVLPQLIGIQDESLISAGIRIAFQGTGSGPFCMQQLDEPGVVDDQKLG